MSNAPKFLRIDVHKGTQIGSIVSVVICLILLGFAIYMLAEKAVPAGIVGLIGSVIGIGVSVLLFFAHRKGKRLWYWPYYIYMMIYVGIIIALSYEIMFMCGQKQPHPDLNEEQKKQVKGVCSVVLASFLVLAHLITAGILIILIIMARKSQKWLGKTYTAPPAPAPAPTIPPLPNANSTKPAPPPPTPLPPLPKNDAVAASKPRNKSLSNRSKRSNSKRSNSKRSQRDQSGRSARKAASPPKKPPSPKENSCSEKECSAKTCDAPSESCPPPYPDDHPKKDGPPYPEAAPTPAKNE